MKNGIIAALAILAFAVMVAACQPDDSGNAVMAGQVESIAQDVRSIKLWIGWEATPKDPPDKDAVTWMQRVFAAVCQLESQHTSLTHDDTLCHDDDLDHGTPPPKPPFN